MEQMLDLSITPSPPGIHEFVSQIAQLTKDGEEVRGKEFIMENDDAVSTLNELITVARGLVASDKEHVSTAEAFIDQYGFWGTHPKYPRIDWVYEVANNDTSIGYWDWVANLYEQDQFAAELEECMARNRETE